jgi:hypothetical protein
MNLHYEFCEEAFPLLLSIFKEMGDGRNLWKSHDRLLGTVRTERQDIVRNIELFLFLDFVVCVQNLRDKVGN